MGRAPDYGRGAGDYNARVTIEKNVPTADGAGQPIADWQSQFDRSAKIASRGGRESWRFRQLRAEISHVIFLRYDAETRVLTAPDYRLDLDGRKLNIGAAFDIDGRHFEMELHCTEVVT